MTRPSRHSLYIATARLWAQRSTCSRLQVGCVITRNGRIMVQGYNGTPANLPHCNHACDCPISGPSDMRGHSPDCKSLKPCLTSVHAEANAIAYAAKWGAGLDGASLYSTHTPCYNCCMLIINAGIFTVGYAEEYRDMSGMKLLHDAGIQVLSPSDIIPW